MEQFDMRRTGLFLAIGVAIAASPMRAQVFGVPDILQFPPPTAGSVAPFVVATQIRPDQTSEWRRQQARLAARQAALITENGPAEQALLDQLATARANAADTERVVRVDAWLRHFAEQIQHSDQLQPLMLPAGAVTLDVALVSLVLQYAPVTPDGRQGNLRQVGEPVLQVARVGSPDQSIIWLPELGYLLIPGNYVSPVVSPPAGRALETLEIGE